MTCKLLPDNTTKLGHLVHELAITCLQFHEKVPLHIEFDVDCTRILQRCVQDSVDLAGVIKKLKDSFLYTNEKKIITCDIGTEVQRFYNQPFGS